MVATHSQDRVRNCGDDAVIYQQAWDATNRPQNVRRQWSPRQGDVLSAVAFAVTMEDAEQQRQHKRRLFVSQGISVTRKLRCKCQRVLGPRSASIATSTRRVALSTVRLALAASLCVPMQLLR